MQANSMETAPRNGTMLRLLVEFEEHATEDGPGPFWTIGANCFDNDGIDKWQFAGWDWCHDCFTQGEGKVVGWLPLVGSDAKPIAWRHNKTLALYDEEGDVPLADGDEWAEALFVISEGCTVKDTQLLREANCNMAAELGELKAKLPTKIEIPPPGAELTDICYAEGWNQCCETFFGNLPPQEPVVIEITHTEAPGKVTITTNPATGECVAVTRQDEEGQILSVIWQKGVK